MTIRHARRFLLLGAVALAALTGAAALAQEDEPPPAEEVKRLYLKSTTAEGNLICAKGCSPTGFCC